MGSSEWRLDCEFEEHHKIFITLSKTSENTYVTLMLLIVMPTLQEIVNLGDALSNPLRIKILQMLINHEFSVYELARELGISRQLLYLHLKKLEKAGLVESDLRLEGNRAKKYYRAKHFNFSISNETIMNLEV